MLYQKNRPQASPRAQLEMRYNTARYNLLLVAAFTVINMIMLISQSGSYFLFSAATPYIITDLAMFFCGMYPAEAYLEYPGMGFFDMSVFYVAVAICAVIIAMYVITFFLSRKGRVAWLFVALGIFIVDTVMMFIFWDISAIIIDILFHVWVIGSLCLGIYSQFKLKKLPPVVETEPEIPEVEPEIPEVNSTENEEK
ncbi:MAG: hypothetical protein IJX46_02465 [Clostridia bacterium]|nr:hypothetical protein [Clostridia bacterium]